MKPYTLLPTVALIGLTSTACTTSPTSPPDPNNRGTARVSEAVLPTISNRDVFLRASFDDDPSSFIGRFVDDHLALAQIDETRGAARSCSKHITYKEIRASGTFSEYHQASNDVEAKLGVKPLPLKGTPIDIGGEAGVNNKRQASLLVKYKMSRKLVSEIKDPEAFEKCCRDTPGNCSNRYIGEFWSGSGEIYTVAGRSTHVDASVSIPTKGDAGVEVRDGWSWRRSTSFEEVYFAMRVYESKQSDSCTWVDELPQSDQGTYFIGISQTSRTEDFARDGAMRHARQQIIKYLGEYITTSDKSRGTMLQGYLSDERMLEATSSGLVSLVKDERYCKADIVKTPEGPMYKVKVLAFFPNKQRTQAARETVNTVKEELRRQQRLSTEEQHELDALATTLESAP